MAAVPASLQLDQRSLVSLKAQASTDPSAAAKEAAKQFETLFMNELLKSMRASTHVQRPDGRRRRRRDGHRDARQAVRHQALGHARRAVGHHRQAAGAADGAEPGADPGARGSANNTPQPLAATPKPTADSADRRRRLRAAAHQRRAQRRGGHRHPGRIHDLAGRAGNRLGPQGDQARRRLALVQPVRHQGRRQLERARPPRSRPPST